MQEEIKKQIEEYNIMHKLDLANNYGIEDEIDMDKNIDIANIINKEYDNLNIDQMRELATKCLTSKQIKRILLSHELKYYRSNELKELKLSTELSLNEFKNIAVNLLNRYQCKAGGFYIEDTEWKVHSYESKEHDIKKYELLFENTVDRSAVEDDDTHQYLEALGKRLNSLASNIDIEIRYKSSRHDSIIWILIWCIDKNIKKSSAKISL